LEDDSTYPHGVAHRVPDRYALLEELAGLSSSQLPAGAARHEREVRVMANHKEGLLPRGSEQQARRAEVSIRHDDIVGFDDVDDLIGKGPGGNNGSRLMSDGNSPAVSRALAARWLWWTKFALDTCC